MNEIKYIIALLSFFLSFLVSPDIAQEIASKKIYEKPVAFVHPTESYPEINQEYLSYEHPWHVFPISRSSKSFATPKCEKIIAYPAYLENYFVIGR